MLGSVSGDGNTKKKTGWTKIPEFEVGEQLLFHLLDGSLRFGDQDAVINKHRKDRPDRTIIQDVHRRVTLQDLEAHINKCGCKLLVPESARLLQAIESLVQFAHLVSIRGDKKPADVFVQFSI